MTQAALPPHSCTVGCAGADLLREESAVDRGVEAGVQAQLQSIPAWRGLNNPWLPDEDAGQDFSYINLLANPERYTGYEVRRMWRSYWTQNGSGSRACCLVGCTAVMLSLYCQHLAAAGSPEPDVCPGGTNTSHVSVAWCALPAGSLCLYRHKHTSLDHSGM